MDERALSNSELVAQYRAILASTLDPVLTIDHMGVIITVSDSIERVFGYRTDEVIGKNISILMPEPHHSRHDEYMAAYRDRGVTNILGRTREFDARRKDGSTFPIELSVARVDVPGRPAPLFTGIIHDITERRRAEAELDRHRQRLEDLVEERTRELNQSLAQLRLADRLASIGSLAAGLGHDMSNIVLPIRCRLDALQQMNLEREASQEVTAVRKWIDYLDELAKGLRLLAQDPESTEADGRTDLAEWWGQVGPLLAKGLPKHVSLVASLAARLPPVAISPHKLTQLMLNLVVNAGEAIEASGAESGKVEVLAAPERDRIRIEVVDDGPGMPADVLARALDPFFTTKSRGLSTGLGLALVTGVINSVKGTLNLESTVGEGTRFTMIVPAAADGDRDEANGAVVLLDDARAAAFVTALLRAAGFDIHTECPAEADDVRILVVEVGDAHEPLVRTCRSMHPDIRILAVGERTDQWNPYDVTLVPPGSLPGLRKAVQDAMDAIDHG